MPRKARERSKTGIYHIVVRGINKQEIFHDEEDIIRYLETLKKVKEISGCQILGYCLMGNHIHLLIKEEKESISTVMKRLGTSYARWYNWKYERSGHVFQDRYRSECVEDDRYLMVVIRYIHQNPVKAGIVEKIGDYRWSSIRAYYGKEEYPKRLTESKLVLELFGENKEEALKRFELYMEEKSDDKCLEANERIHLNDKEVRKKIRKILKNKPVTILQQMNKDERDKILRKIKSIKGSSLRQISRITGIGVYIIHKA